MSNDSVVLHDGTAVNKAFYTQILSRIKMRLPTLLRGKAYTAKQLCGDSFWLQLTDGNCRLAGKCILNMVELGELPLKPVETKHEYPKYYELK
jgi:hypothetical protein